MSQQRMTYIEFEALVNWLHASSLYWLTYFIEFIILKYPLSTCKIRIGSEALRGSIINIWPHMLPAVGPLVINCECDTA